MMTTMSAQDCRASGQPSRVASWKPARYSVERRSSLRPPRSRILLELTALTEELLTFLSIAVICISSSVQLRRSLRSILPMTFLPRQTWNLTKTCSQPSWLSAKTLSRNVIFLPSRAPQLTINKMLTTLQWMKPRPSPPPSSRSRINRRK